MEEGFLFSVSGFLLKEKTGKRLFTIS